MTRQAINLHELLDLHYGPDGDDRLRARVLSGVDLEQRFGPLDETPLHVAARRRRCSAVEILLAGGAEIDARTAGGKTAYAHAVRRDFDDVATILQQQGADTSLAPPDLLAVKVVTGDLEGARALLQQTPDLVCTGNPEEDRLLADVAGRMRPEPVALLVRAGADLEAPGLDDGTPLHQACWFGQPQNARLLLEAGAPLEVFDATHESSPLGWAVHGSRYSGGADEAQESYVEITRMLLEAGACMQYPGDPSDAYRRRLLSDATTAVAEVLLQFSN